MWKGSSELQFHPLLPDENSTNFGKSRSSASFAKLDFDVLHQNFGLYFRIFMFSGKNSTFENGTFEKFGHKRKVQRFMLSGKTGHSRISAAYSSSLLRIRSHINAHLRSHINAHIQNHVKTYIQQKLHIKLPINRIEAGVSSYGCHMGVIFCHTVIILGLHGFHFGPIWSDFQVAWEQCGVILS